MKKSSSVHFKDQNCRFHNLATIFGLYFDLPSMPKRLQILLKILVALLFALVLLLGSLSLYVYSHQEEIKGRIVTVLNGHLDSPVTVGGPIYVSLFENFPSISLSFPNISIKAVNQTVVQDYPLLSAQKLSLSFSLFDLFAGRYTLEQLTITDAAIDLRFDADGHPNYNIWKAQNTTSSTEANFAINKLVLKRVKLNYLNASENQLLSASFTDADFSGDFSQRKFRLLAKASLEGGSLQLEDKQFLKNQQLQVNLSMEVDLDAETVTFPNSELRLNRERLQLQGFHRWGEPFETDLNFAAESFRAAQLLAFYQDDEGFFKELEVDGDLNLKGRWHYTPNAPELSITASLREAKLAYKALDLQYRGSTNIRATYSRQGQLDLHFDDLQLNQKGGDLTGKLHYRQRDNLLEGEVQGRIDLDPYQKALTAFEISNVSGTAQLNHRFQLYPGTDKPLLIAGTLRLENTAGQYPGYTFGALTGDFTTTAGAKPELQMQIERLQLDSIALVGQLRIANYPALYDNKAGSMQLSGKLKADRWRWATESNESATTSTPLPISNFDLQLAVDRFYWYDFTFEDLDVQLTGHTGDMRIQLNNWQLAKGKLNGRLRWQEVPAGFVLQGALQGKKMDISALFSTFNNFDQSFLTHEHLSGQLDVKSSVLLRFDKNYNLLPKQMEVVADLDLQQGGLTNFAPLNSLSKFVDAKELQNLRFQRLTNHIEIINGIIDIPQMDINSNATRMSISGKHTLDNAYTYYIQLSLSDLWKKRQKQITFDPNLAEEKPDGGVKLFLVLQGQGDDFSIRYNKLEVRDQLKQGATAVRKDLGKLIKEEFDGTARQKTYENNRLDDIAPIPVEADTLQKEPEKEFDPVYLRKPKSRRGG